MTDLDSPAEGKLHLVLYRPPDITDSLYLDIPATIPDLLCRHPRKYLRYLGWCILGVEGRVSMTLPHSEDDIGDEGTLEDQGVYHYHTEGDPEGGPLSHAVEPEVIKSRSKVLSGSSGAGSSTTRQAFRGELEERDFRCVVSGLREYEAAHIIPYARQDEWFEGIVNSRIPYDEDVSTLKFVNDIRNGMIVNDLVHRYLDSRKAAFLKTPNRILNTEDVPYKPGRVLRPEVEYPVDERFTLQNLTDDEEREELESQVNFLGLDAAFKRSTDLRKPSDLLLHYKYGATAVKRWGRHIHHLSGIHRNNIPRPSVQVTTGPDGPSRSINDRSIAIGKRERQGGPSGSNQSKRQAVGNSDTAELVVEAVDGSSGWDADDWMMFFAQNTKFARERRQAAEEEFSSRINKWASEVAHT